MKLTILLFWNLNTWRNRARGITNEHLWNWALEHCSADIHVFTEAATPPPERYSEEWWFVYRSDGFRRRKSWGTVIALRKSTGLELKHLTRAGEESSYRLDTHFPGSLTAADVIKGDKYILRLVGMYLPYRKDKARNFVSRPSSDLVQMRDDFDALATAEVPLVIGGDLNEEYSTIPTIFETLGRGNKRMVDPFAGHQLITFQQDWGNRKRFCLDYLYLSQDLAENIVDKRGGLDDFPTAFTMSDHAPLSVTVELRHG